MPLEFIDSLTSGILQLAAEHGVTLIGGDTCASRSGLVIAITAYGEQLPGTLIRRSGARPGDDIFVTGTVGDAALGLQLLRQGQRSGHAVERQLNPTPRVRLGTALAEAGLPTAMIDISDGLLADLGHVTRHAAVAARLCLDQLPLSTEYLRYCSRAADRYDLALTGGEDYELLFTAPRERTQEIIDLGVAHGTGITAIGAIGSGSGVTVHKVDGTAYTVKKSGHDHFRHEEIV
jgi:thiamine-monophosphate kinase